MSGADLANLMNEAAIMCARQGKDAIDMSDVAEAIEKIQIGLKKKGSRTSLDTQRLVAYHEAGHALLGAMIENYDMVSKISIVPRG